MVSFFDQARADSAQRHRATNEAAERARQERERRERAQYAVQQTQKLQQPTGDRYQIAGGKAVDTLTGQLLNRSQLGLGGVRGGGGTNALESIVKQKNLQDLARTRSPQQGGGFGTAPPRTTEVTGATAYNPTGGATPQTQSGQAAFELGERRLKDAFDRSITSTTRDLNRRGLFGSSIADENVGRVNQAQARGLADLASGIAGQEAGFNTQNVSNFATLEQLKLQKDLADQQKQSALFNLFS